MKLYFAPGACSLTVRIIINEIGLDCQYDHVDLRKKTTATGEDFTKINAKGAVPTLQLNNGEVLTENAVILQYLADANNATTLLPSKDDFNRYRVLEWLNYVATELHKSVGALYNPALPAEFKEMQRNMIKTKYHYVNKHLANHQYLLGETFTLPDAYLFVITTWLIYFKFDLNEWPNVKRYLNELKNRQSIKQSLQDEKLKTDMLA